MGKLVRQSEILVREILCLMGINFTLWKSSMEDYLVQMGIDDTLEKEKPNNIEEGKMDTMKDKVISTIRLTIAPEIK